MIETRPTRSTFQRLAWLLGSINYNPSLKLESTKRCWMVRKYQENSSQQVYIIQIWAGSSLYCCQRWACSWQYHLKYMKVWRGYLQSQLQEDGGLDWDGLERAVKLETQCALIQRSCGYSWRKTLTVAEIERAIILIKARQRMLTLNVLRSQIWNLIHALQGGRNSHFFVLGRARIRTVWW